MRAKTAEGLPVVIDGEPEILRLREVMQASRLTAEPKSSDPRSYKVDYLEMDGVYAEGLLTVLRRARDGKLSTSDDRQDKRVQEIASVALEEYENSVREFQEDLQAAGVDSKVARALIWLGSSQPHPL